MSDRVDIERVREAVDLVALISEFVPLKAKGQEWVGVCPFHDDHKPSMNVVTHKGNSFYKCFSCDASGDCFSFVQEYLKKDFGEALNFLAERNGIELTGRQSEEEGQASKRNIRNAMEWAVKLYREALATTKEGEIAFKALRSRGFTDESIETFSIGVSPDSWQFLADRVHDNEDRIRTCVEAGLLKKKEESSRVYDAFRNRLMFPIFDETGSPIAFGGRRLNEEDEPKYINSPETALFHKSNSLYGFSQARQAIQKLKKAIVVEGYTDVIACHQAGILNVVATLGTSLTKDHADRLSRICDEVILVFDGDDAGQRAADRAIEVFFSKSLDVRICVLPDSKDPADLAFEADALLDHFSKAIEAMEFKLNRLESSLKPVDTIAGKTKAIELFLDDLIRLGIENLGGVRRSLVYERIASLLKTSMSEVQSYISQKKKMAPASVAKANSPIASANSQDSEIISRQPVNVTRARQLAEHELLAILLFDPVESSRILGEIEETIASVDFIDPNARIISEKIIPMLKAGTPCTMQELLMELDEGCKSLASTLYFNGQRICQASGTVMLALQETLGAFMRTLEDKAIAEEVLQLKSVEDPKERAEAAQRTLETIRRQKKARSVL